MSHGHKIPSMAFEIDVKNFDHLVATAERVLTGAARQKPVSNLDAFHNDARELAEVFLIFAKGAKESE